MTYVWLARRVATLTKYLVLLAVVHRDRDDRGAPKIQSDLLAPNLCHDAHMLSSSLPQIVVVTASRREHVFLLRRYCFLNEIVSVPFRPRVQPIINLRDSPSEHTLTF